MSLITKWQVSELDSPTNNALREELNLRYAEIENLQQQLAAKERERERLRTALVIIAEWDCKCRWAECCDCSSRMQSIAEAAAGGEGNAK